MAKIRMNKQEQAWLDHIQSEALKRTNPELFEPDKPRCEQCGMPIDDATMEFWMNSKGEKGQEIQPPKLCGSCGLDAIKETISVMEREQLIKIHKGHDYDRLSSDCARLRDAMVNAEVGIDRLDDMVGGPEYVIDVAIEYFDNLAGGQ